MWSALFIPSIHAFALSGPGIDLAHLPDLIGGYRCSDSGSRTHLRTCPPLCRGYRRLPLNLSGELNPPRPSRRIASDAVPCVHAGSLSLCVVMPVSCRCRPTNLCFVAHPSPQHPPSSWRTIGGTASPHHQSIHTSDYAGCIGCRSNRTPRGMQSYCIHLMSG